MAYDQHIILKNDNGTTTTIVFDNTERRDTTITLPSMSDKVLTKKRFETAMVKLKDYMQSPNENKLIDAPVINSVRLDGTDLILDLEPYESCLFLRLACVKIRINNNVEFIPPTHDHHNLRVSLTTPVLGSTALNTGLQDNQRVTVGVTYMADGRNSAEVTKEFIYRTPIDGIPYIESVAITPFSLDTGKCNVVVNALPGRATTATHESTDWIIEKKVANEFVEVYTSKANTRDKTSIDLGPLVMSRLDMNTEYYVYCRFNYDGGRTTLYGERYRFITPNLTLTPVSSLKSYPNHVFISNPELEIPTTYNVSNGNETRELKPTEITQVVWRVYEGNALVEEERGSYKWKLRENTLRSNKNYKVQLFYTTGLFGTSPVTNFDLKTLDFNKEMDGLKEISSKYQGYSYFGEIEGINLMQEGIRYRGFYDTQLQYTKLDEVNKDGKLYICVRNTPNADYSFNVHFKEVTTPEAKGLYRSGLPTYKELMSMLGLPDNLSNADAGEEPLNVLNKTDGYLKLELPNGNIAYMTTKPIYGRFTVNDLVKANLLHPYQRTIRIGAHLYYPRLLTKEATYPYEPVYGDFANRNFLNQFNPTNKVVPLNEEFLLPMLLNGRLANHSIPKLSINNLAYEELLYHRDRLQVMKLETTASMYNMVSIPLDNVDKSDLTMRIVLERIDSKHPMDNISNLIVGNNTKQEGLYDPYGDVAYLGYVTDDEFLNTESVLNRLGLSIGTTVLNSGWFKFYYQGMIYFFSDGLNLKNVNYNTLRDNNLASIHALLTNAKGRLPDSKMGRVHHNNLVYNVSLPSVVNYSRMFSSIKVSGALTDIFSVTNPDVDLRVADNCFFSSTIHAIKKGKMPLKLTNGYKGSYPEYDFGELTKGVGGNESNQAILTRNELKDGNVIVNNEQDIYSISKQLVNAMGRVVFCLTIPAILE